MGYNKEIQKRIQKQKYFEIMCLYILNVGAKTRVDLIAQH